MKEGYFYYVCFTLYKMNYKVIEQSETSSCLIQLCDDGVVRVMGKSNQTLDEEQMRKNIEIYNILIKGELYSFLYYPEDDSFVFGSDAISYAKSNQNSFPKLGIAVVVNSLAHKLVANFYLKISPQKSPFKIFNTMGGAEAWCHELVSKHYNKINLK